MRRIAPLTRRRAERLTAGVSLAELSIETGFCASYHSQYERNLRELNPDQLRRRREALARLAAKRRRETA